MKFSFSLIKKFAPGKYTLQELSDKLNRHSFEAVDIGGDILEISVTANRFSDASSHIGIAREAAIIMNVPFKDPAEAPLKFTHKDKGVFRVNVKNKKSCPRYMAASVYDVKIGPSPAWLKESLESCGMRSINNVVDVMNYVMLETGQPLHAFDADKVKGGLIVRNANQGEIIETIDNQKFTLDKEILVIADADKALAIAGIKGGKSSEVTISSKRLLIESANFRSSEIYTSSKKLSLKTDASVRFSHTLSPELAARGMKRALMLLQEVAGAKIHPPVDIYPKKQSKEVLALDLEKIQNIIGAKLKRPDIEKLLTRLGFSVKGKKIEVPLLRMDIQDVEDLAEEIIRFRGYENLTAQPPHIALGVASEEELVTLKDQIRNFLVSVGYSEVYNYSLVSESECNQSPVIIRRAEGKIVRLANPMSAQLAVMRDSLTSGLMKNLKDNRRFYDEVRIFEIGHVFQEVKDGIEEKTVLGVALSAKNSLLDTKGVADLLLSRLGITDYSLVPMELGSNYMKPSEILRIEIDGVAAGYLGSLSGTSGAILELDLGLLLNQVDAEREYAPLAKYPAVTRDLSLLIGQEIRVGSLMEFIQQANMKLIENVDLVDWYEDEKLGDNKKSLTFRIVFRSEERTLTDAEVDKEMAAINQAIAGKFSAESR